MIFTHFVSLFFIKAFTGASWMEQTAIDSSLKYILVNETQWQTSL